MLLGQHSFPEVARLKGPTREDELIVFALTSSLGITSQGPESLVQPDGGGSAVCFLRKHVPPSQPQNKLEVAGAPRPWKLDTWGLRGPGI